MRVVDGFPSWEGKAPSGAGVGCGLGNDTHPGAARHPSEGGDSQKTETIGFCWVCGTWFL